EPFVLQATLQAELREGVVVSDLARGRDRRNQEIIAAVSRAEVQQNGGRQRVIVVQPIQRRGLESTQRSRKRVRQTVGPAEDGIAVGIRRFGALPEERQFSFGSDGLVEFQGRDLGDSCRV